MDCRGVPIPTPVRQLDTVIKSKVWHSASTVVTPVGSAEEDEEEDEEDDGWSMEENELNVETMGGETPPPIAATADGPEAAEGVRGLEEEGPLLEEGSSNNKAGFSTAGDKDSKCWYGIGEGDNTGAVVAEKGEDMEEEERGVVCRVTDGLHLILLALAR